MKSITKLLGMAFLISVPAISVMADRWRNGLVGKTEITWSGTLSAVDLRNHCLEGETWWYIPQTFVLGKQCDVSVMGQDKKGLADLHPGDSLRVTYRDADGVLIADHIVDLSLRYQGTVQSVDPDSNTMTVGQGRQSRTFTLADEGKVVTAEGMDGSLYDLTPGDMVTIIYAQSNHSRVASQIHEMTLSYQGKLEAVDLPQRIVKAADALSEQQFSVADHCRIILAGNKSAQLKDLELEHDYTISYEQINGVKVADRITQVTSPGTNNLDFKSSRLDETSSDKGHRRLEQPVLICIFEPSAGVAF